MKYKQLCLISLVALPMSVMAGGGGLNSIGLGGGKSGLGKFDLSGGDDSAYGQEQPLKFTLSTGIGYDDNVTTSATNDEDAFFARAGIAASYSYMTETMGWQLGTSYSALYYLDDVRTLDEDFFHNARISSSYYRSVNERLSFSHSLYFSYEFEPDFETGATTYRRDDQYLYGYNDISVSYAWAPRFSTVSGYTINGVAYDDDVLATLEDRLTHIFRQQFRYAMTPVTTLIAEYRYEQTNFDTDIFGRDSDRHFALAGLEHQVSEDTSASFRVGATFLDYDNGISETKPFVEAGARMRLDENTSLRWTNRLGFEDSETQSVTTDSRYTYRTSLRLSHRVSERLRTNATASYSYSDFDGSRSFEQNHFGLGLGASYVLFDNTSLNASYRFTNIDSTRPNSDYDRNIVTIGVSTTF